MAGKNDPEGTASGTESEQPSGVTDDSPEPGRDGADDADQPEPGAKPKASGKSTAPGKPAANGKPAKRPGTASPTDDRRRAARIATLVAVPVTILAAIGAFAVVSSAASESPDDQPDQAESVPVPSEPVSVDAPELSDDDATVCLALTATVPDTLIDLPQRTVTADQGPASDWAAAWGEPAVAMRCGVDKVEVASDAQVYRLGHACWYAEEGEDASTWTTVDRSIPVEMTVPSEHIQPGQLVQAVSDIVADKVPGIEDAPTGCTG